MKSTMTCSERVDCLRQLIADADRIIIGAGSGLSTAAGIDYGGEDFQREFAPWIERYGITDLYTSSFYPFETEEERWAYWAKHIWFSRYRTGATQLYSDLCQLVQHRAADGGFEYFVVTTNVDGQFDLAGFDKSRLFATQGDYCYFQPASGSPKKLENNREWVMEVLPMIENCRIPSTMVPRMSDGQPATTNLRVDDTFVEDFHWHQQAAAYKNFVADAANRKLLLLEFGIGYNTPGIIRLPFEQMAQRFADTTLVRFNRDNPEAYISDLQPGGSKEGNLLTFTEDIQMIIDSLIN